MLLQHRHISSSNRGDEDEEEEEEEKIGRHEDEVFISFSTDYTEEIRDEQKKTYTRMHTSAAYSMP